MPTCVRSTTQTSTDAPSFRGLTQLQNSSQLGMLLSKSFSVKRSSPSPTTLVSVNVASEGRFHFPGFIRRNRQGPLRQLRTVASSWYPGPESLLCWPASPLQPHMARLASVVNGRSLCPAVVPLPAIRTAPQLRSATVVVAPAAARTVKMY